MSLPSSRSRRGWGSVIAIVILVALAVFEGVAGQRISATGAERISSVASVTQAITVSSADTGRVFDGVGAISGGGGNSRLLTDYPQAEQSSILDYLFKPGYGANLQMLKVEIGGDANSTDGSEASIEHTSGVIDCNAGYEFWLAKQALARNPAIQLYGLSWTAPGWIGTFFSTAEINYLISWLNCAKSDGLNVNSLGGWNERGYNITWYEQLRSALNSAGFSSVQIVGADSDGVTDAQRWQIATDINADPSFASAVGVIGVHYPCGGNGGAADECTTTPDALASGKPLWASEQGSQDTNAGAAAWIRDIVRGYVDAKITADLNWPLLSADYPNLPFATDGLAVAEQPWSGAYSVGKTLWVTAQVTQFTAPGWHFLDQASGYLGGDRANGGYVSLASPDGQQFSTVIETSTATAPQTVTLNVAGTLPTGPVHVWSTSLGSGPAFVQQADISSGSTITLQPDMIYTLSTVSTAGKGTATSPQPQALALPYTDDFTSEVAGSPAKYFADMQGSFEVQPCTGRKGQCLEQMAAQKPIEWQGDSDAFSLMGDVNWANYTVTADTRLAAAGTVELFGRANTQARPQSNQNGYEFRVSNTGAWSIQSTDIAGDVRTLAQGTITALGVGQWHTLSLTMNGTTISGAVDHVQVASVTDGLWTSGQAGLGVTDYQNAQFDSFNVTAASGGATPAVGALQSGLAGRCALASGNTAVNGASVVLGNCTDPGASTWTVVNGTLRFDGMCADANLANTADEPILLWTCNGGSNQLWLPQSNGELVGAHSQMCLTAAGDGSAADDPIELQTCTASTTQDWKIP